MIRAELARSFDIDGLKQKDINRLVHEINGRPLKCLGYQTPQELFLNSKKG